MDSETLGTSILISVPLVAGGKKKSQVIHSCSPRKMIHHHRVLYYSRIIFPSNAVNVESRDRLFFTCRLCLYQRIYIHIIPRGSTDPSTGFLPTPLFHAILLETCICIDPTPYWFLVEGPSSSYTRKRTTWTRLCERCFSLRPAVPAASPTPSGRHNRIGIPVLPILIPCFLPPLLKCYVPVRAANSIQFNSIESDWERKCIPYSPGLRESFQEKEHWHVERPIGTPHSR